MFPEEQGDWGWKTLKVWSQTTKIKSNELKMKPVCCITTQNDIQWATQTFAWAPLASCLPSEGQANQLHHGLLHNFKTVKKIK